MAKQSALDVVLAYQEAWTSKEYDTAASYLAEGVIFDGPKQYLQGSKAFMDGLIAFAGRVLPGWEKIAAFGDDHEALLMYTVATNTGATVRAADYYLVEDDKIQVNKTVFVTIER